METAWNIQLCTVVTPKVSFLLQLAVTSVDSKNLLSNPNPPTCFLFLIVSEQLFPLLLDLPQVQGILVIQRDNQRLPLLGLAGHIGLIVLLKGGREGGRWMNEDNGTQVVDTSLNAME